MRRLVYCGHPQHPHTAHPQRPDCDYAITA